ncbi:MULTISPECIES: YhcN/YlaJ family sporulation lipoprotein [unclassified Paenibacillus]|uniref:YhcN/YlaJ family sporulation lipoprotein n=1 Tax=Paenibacillus provencensis TaxID=441151 RepID=A0ABW3Q2J9_9BACL|nr:MULTISPECIES: YhcN/YlaJ family sporulation lipoprotein [unclassified Paenibacillus]MCM3129882.1 YhcN/YlaJ family sporulation lipoprotein [Paenibacillus sp. MER 78]SFS91220.1 sporulation lipoprotein, YhcN/YlaJ family [Paenibacillus sp. 453mf]
MPGMNKTKAITLSLSTALLVMSGLTGCGTNTDHNLNTNQVRNNKASNNKQFGLNANSVHRTNNLRNSDDLSKVVSDMDGVGNAYVLLTDNNAYVAVSLKDGVQPQSTRHHNQRNMKSKNLSSMGVKTGTRAPYTTSGIAPGLTNDYSQSNMLGDNANGPRGAGGIFNPNNVRMNETKGPTTYTKMNDHDVAEEDVSDLMKKEITGKIKELAPNVKNVYISANPDFVGRAQGYVNDVAEGRPISGFIDEFQTMMDRLFPTNGTMMDNNKNR